MTMLSLLVARPGEEIHVLELAGVGKGRAPASDAGEHLDQEAVARYRQRYEALRERQREAEARQDTDAVERARMEMEALSRELSRGVGLGGRRRRAGSNVDRARVNVRRRLKHAIVNIANACPGLGRHLDLTLSTGTFCSYLPDGRPGISGA
jgi:uncharacterized protein YPO0396